VDFTSITLATHTPISVAPIPKVLSPDTNMFITDGPFLETKEHIGGFWILEAADMDEALA
jgi:hypothetical protein